MTEPRVLISVVIPCYNDGIYLRETLSRLKQQTYTHYEVLIVDDGSTDPHTLAVFTELEKEGYRVLHKENGRMSSARNYGVRHAQGSVLALLDADDYFHPRFFEKGLRVLAAEPDTAVVTSHIQLFGEFRKTARPRGGTAWNFLFSNQCPACALVRKSCWDEVGGYDESMIWGYEDWEFYIRITKKWRVRVIPEKLLFYRQTRKSTHRNQTLPNREKIIAYILDKHGDWYLEQLKALINRQEVIYTGERVSFQRLARMLRNRLFPPRA
ncbi:MAG TPA: glycosyltransferase family A protein [Chitinophagaceae bacterium]|nr:glycosyltransferase family A protein [Chitinophagaceae bacterium]